MRCLYLGVALSLAVAAGAARAQLSLVGEWTGRYHEDQGDRVPGDVQGDFTGVPMNDAARKFAEAFDVTRVAVGSSRVDLQACKLEYSIVSPK